MPRATAKALEWGAILAILMLAIYLRMGNPGVVEFKRDEANLSLLALDFANGGDVPLLGIGSSVGVPNAPVNVYVLAIPYFFTSNPQVATQFIGLLNVFAVLLTYWLGRRYGGVFAGLTAALLLTANPWAVIFSRKIWAQNMLPVFILLTIGSGLLGFVDRKRWAKVLHFPLLAITGQIHYGAFVIVPVSLYLLLRDRRGLRYVVIGVVLAFLVTLPYVIGMVRAGWDDPQRVIEAVSAGDDAAKDTPLISLQSVDGARLLFEGAEIHSLAGPEAFDDYLETVPEVGIVLSIFSVMLVISSGWLILRIVKRNDARTPVDIVLLLWLLLPIVIYSVDWTTFFIHYLIPVLPAGFLIIGFCIQDLTKFLAKRNLSTQSFRGFAYAGVVGIAILQAILFVRLLNFLDTHHTPDGFGTPLHYLLDVRDAIFANDAPVIGQLDGMAVGISDDVTVWAALLYDGTDVRFETEGTTVYPAEASTLLSYCDKIQQPQAIFRSRPDDLCYALATRPAGMRTAMLEPVEASFANGVKIEGYRWVSNCLSVWWRITEEAQADYHFAVKFVDEQAREIQGADGLSWFGRYWRPGDTVKRDFCINPADAVLAEQVRLGMYTFDGTSFYNVDILEYESNFLIIDL